MNKQEAQRERILEPAEYWQKMSFSDEWNPFWPLRKIIATRFWLDGSYDHRHPLLRPPYVKGKR